MSLAELMGTVLGIMLAGLMGFGVAHIQTDGVSGPWRVYQTTSRCNILLTLI